MYGHPLMVKKWAKAMKPAPTRAQIAQAELMRKAKVAFKRFQQRQIRLFKD